VTLNLDLVGTEWSAGTATWCSRDALIYALSVGAGQLDPADELAYTTENTIGVTQAVLPTFLVTRRGDGHPSLRLGDISGEQILHGSQGLTVHRPISADGAASVVTRVDRMLDKGRDAVIEMSSELTDVASGEPLAQTRTALFIRGAGGFGGPRGERSSVTLPKREPEFRFSAPTRTDQALLYRLSGDRNPLHSDPQFAARAGFARPILHGLCSYGIVARLLVNGVFDGDTSRFGQYEARFASPVLPGETLDVAAWMDGDDVKFVACVGDRVVLDRGVLVERGNA